MITRLEQMTEILQGRREKQLVVAAANDSHTLAAVEMAREKGFVRAVLVGDRDAILQACKEEKLDPGAYTMVHEPDPAMAAKKAVELIRQGKGDLLMKGLVSTDIYMKAILDKESGLMDPGTLLSHVTVIEVPAYHKLLIVGDVAVIPRPEIREKAAILNYLIRTARSLGIEKPRVAVLAATEQVLQGMQACTDAAVLSKMAARGQFGDVVVDGPLALDVILDKESARIKKLNSPVAGEADCILFPDIESGNVFYKSATKLAGGKLGAVVAGARVPAVLSSRGDSPETKLYSIALAAMMT